VFCRQERRIQDAFQNAKTEEKTHLLYGAPGAQKRKSLWQEEEVTEREVSVMTNAESYTEQK
jgi:hypothetical protein